MAHVLGVALLPGTKRDLTARYLARGATVPCTLQLNRLLAHPPHFRCFPGPGSFTSFFPSSLSLPLCIAPSFIWTFVAVPSNFLPFLLSGFLPFLLPIHSFIRNNSFGCNPPGKQASPSKSDFDSLQFPRSFSYRRGQLLCLTPNLAPFSTLARLLENNPRSIIPIEF